MTYSVWNPSVNAYDYYEYGANIVSTPVPSHLKWNTAQLGLAPDQAAWALPGAAKYTGRGKFPKGMVATPSQFVVGDVSDAVNWIVVAGLLGAAYGVWRYAR